MPKFKNKKTKQIVEENLLFYVEKLRNNPNFEEVKENKASEKTNEENKPQNK